MSEEPNQVWQHRIDELETALHDAICESVGTIKRLAEVERQLAEARTDARLAVALAYQRAGEVAHDHTPEKHGGMTLQAHVTGRTIEAAILALADQDALAELAALRAERDYWKSYATEQVGMLSLETAEVARLTGLMEEAYALGFEASGEGWNGEYAPFEVREDPDWQEKRRQTLAALKGDTP